MLHIRPGMGLNILRRPEADLGRLPIQLDLRAINLAEGVRAALSVAVIVAINEWLGWPPLLQAALGAMFTCLCDSSGPIWRRLPGLLAFGVFGAALTVLFGWLRETPLYVVIPLTALAIFATAFARVWGQQAMQVGNLLTVVLVLAVSRPFTPADDAILAACLWAGSLWATFLTLVLWRVRPFGPARLAVAQCYGELALLVADMRRLLAEDSPTPAWDAHARAHRRAVREAIETARKAVIDTIRGPGKPGARAAQALIRLAAADQLFGALIALSDLLERERNPEARAAGDRVLRMLRPILVVLATSVRNDRLLAEQRFALTCSAMERAAAGSPALARIIQSLIESVRTAATLSSETAARAVGLPQENGAALKAMVLDPVRSNLTWSSATLRHSLRASLAAAPAQLLTLLLYHGYEYWLTITLVLTLQPYFALTWQRALERIGGTVLGGVIGAVIAMYCTTPIAMTGAIFPLALIAFSVRQVSFGAFITALTPIVVLLVELGRPGSDEISVLAYRAGYTLLGGILAVLCCLFLWPSWEPDRLRREVAAAIAAHRRYAVVAFARLLDAGPAEGLDQARRAAGVASNNLEASISRALAEPGRGQDQEMRLEAAMLIDATLRRMAGQITAFAHEAAPGPSSADWRRWRDWLLGAMAAAEEAHAPPDRPEGRPPEAMARIIRQADVLAGALARLRGMDQVPDVRPSAAAPGSMRPASLGVDKIGA